MSNPESTADNHATRQAKPIIMSGDNPKLILEGIKTQTRRICQHQPDYAENGKAFIFARAGLQSGPKGFESADLIEIPCPYGVAGDRLWVRETWARNPEIHATVPGACLYRADRGGDYQGAAQGDFKWKPSIHMPRWASRITLEITKVRVERLQDISAGDCVAEGRKMPGVGLSADVHIIRSNFASRWDSLHGKGAWDKNPWVWVIEFRKVVES